MNTPVKFEIAKLLKEKGFDTIDCNGYYHICNGYTRGYAHCYSDVNTQKEDAILAPTIADVAMWLYDKHGIWINIYYKSKYKSWDYEYTNINWSQEEADKKLEEDIHNLLDNIFNAKIKYNSPTEAYEAAIEYTLKNLI